MEWSLLAVLLHVLVAFVFVAGLLGRAIILGRASRAADVEAAHLLAQTAGPYEQIVIRGGTLLVPTGLFAAWARGYEWAGLTTGWLLLSAVLLLSATAFVPTVFLPRGKVFEAAMAEARRAGVMTGALRAAFADPAVAFARRYELTVVAIVIVLMVLKPL